MEDGEVMGEEYGEGAKEREMVGLRR